MNSLQCGVKAHQEGRLQEAQQYYLKHLSVVSDDPDALQLLGLIYSAQGEIDKAIASMQYSLRVAPQQAHVLNNLGICQKEKGLFREARISFEQAIDNSKKYLDAYKNLIRLLLDIGSHNDARYAIDQAIVTFGHEMAIEKLNARYYQVVENHIKAIEIYEKLLQFNPASVSVKHSLALNYRMVGNPAKALEFYNQLEATGISPFELFHNKANALSDLGHLSDAVGYYRKAINLNPLFVESHENLNALLWELVDNDHFLRSYEYVFKTEAFDQLLGFSYVSMLLRISRYEEALKFLNNLPVNQKDGYEYFNLLGRALKGLDRDVDALEQQAKAQTYPDVPVDVSLNFAETLLESGDVERAESVVQGVLDADNGNNHGWALLGVIWEIKGDIRHTTLNDYSNLVRVYTIETPEGFDSVEEFCGQLNAYLLTLHTAKTHPLEQTLTGGTQTRGNLFNDSNTLIQTLVDKFRLCIKEYIESTQVYTGNLPIIKSADAFHFSGSWSVSLERGGFHAQHVHPMGWLSSAFYIKLPESIENDQNKEGWFKLGEPNIELPEPVNTVKYIKPVVGKLVLFPSYMWHGTTPFKSAGNRMTIAFDVARGEKRN